MTNDVNDLTAPHVHDDILMPLSFEMPL